MNTTEAIISIAAGLAVNEFCDISPWAARKIIAWSARAWYGKCERAEVRAEELAALINSRPGKLFKLLTALAFACRATSARAQRTLLLLRLLLYALNPTPNQAIVVRGDEPLHDLLVPDFEREKELQLVAASNLISVGMDLDLDVAYRTTAPTNNLVQVTGRVNRRSSG